jgi:hypothetical protein
MAKVSSNTVKRITKLGIPAVAAVPEESVLEKTYFLDLTADEAAFLRNILGLIGGRPEGPRGLADSIREALDCSAPELREASAKIPRALKQYEGTIFFADSRCR